MIHQRIAIFASGSGTNAQRIMEHFRGHPRIRVSLVMSNNASAGVLSRAHALHVPTLVFSRRDFYASQHILDILSVHCIDYLILAGFLWLIPDYLLHAFPSRIINIHPALLPAYGGKGMYGSRVHEAVISAGEKESGISVHFVNERYDEGELIFQARCRVDPADTPDTLAARIHELEHMHYPVVIQEVMEGKWESGLVGE